VPGRQKNKPGSHKKQKGRSKKIKIHFLNNENGFFKELSGRPSLKQMIKEGSNHRH
jgi:DNA invertase Pin-like site-specific DNA recombinase